MEKWLIDRRVDQMSAEGGKLRPGVLAGKVRAGKGVTDWATETMAPEKLAAEFDAVVLWGGAEQSRDLPVPGRELDGVYFAMEFLPLQNKRVAGDERVPDLWATDKHVVVIGGGDTGSGRVGTPHPPAAKSVTPFHLLPPPPHPPFTPV